VACHDSRLAVGYRSAGFQVIPHKWDWGVGYQARALRTAVRPFPASCGSKAWVAGEKSPAAVTGTAGLLKPITPPPNPYLWGGFICQAKEVLPWDLWFLAAPLKTSNHSQLTVR
jgi:hypothetical protein